jgi:hypothetical protein
MGDRQGCRFFLSETNVQRELVIALGVTDCVYVVVGARGLSLGFPAVQCRQGLEQNVCCNARGVSLPILSLTSVFLVSFNIHI